MRDPVIAARLLAEGCAALRRLRLVRGASRRTARRIAEATAVVALALGLLGAAPLAEPADALSVPSFAATSTNPFGLADVGSAAAPTLADIDGDGDLDAFIGERYGDTLFFRNTGSATLPALAAPSTNPFGLAGVGFVAVPAFADIDGDGDLDAFVGNNAGNTIFFRNTGSAIAPAFAAASTNPFGLADVGVFAAPEFADIDGDGDLDAFIGERYGNTIFFRNTGSAIAPAFAAASTNPFGLADVGFVAAPALADIDGDGDLDAFVGNNDGNTFFFHNTGSAIAPAFAAPSTNPFGLAGVGSVATPAFADIDGDGDLDAFIGNNEGNTIFFRNDATVFPTVFNGTTTNPFGLAGVGSFAAPAFADIDGDGDLDALIGDEFGSMFFFRNTGSATAPAFAAASANPFGLADVGDLATPAFADIDGDGDLDVFVGNESSYIIFFRNTGSAIAPAFAAPSTNAFGLSDEGFLALPTFADIDGDGDLDVFIGKPAPATRPSSATPVAPPRPPSPPPRPTPSAWPTSGTAPRRRSRTSTATATSMPSSATTTATPSSSATPVAPPRPLSPPPPPTPSAWPTWGHLPRRRSRTSTAPATSTPSSATATATRSSSPASPCCRPIRRRRRRPRPLLQPRRPPPPQRRRPPERRRRRRRSPVAWAWARVG